MFPGEWDWMKSWGGPDLYGKVAGIPQGGIFSTPQISGGVMGDDPTAARRDGLMAAAAQLLAGSGASPVRKTFGELVGQAMLAGQQARGVSQDRAQDRRYKDAQIKALEKREKEQASPFGTIDPDQFTPESLKAFQESGDYGVLVAREGGQKLGNVNPGDFTPESLEKFLKTGNYADLRRYVTPANPTVQVIGGVPSVVQPSRAGGQPVVQPLSNLPAEAGAAGTIAGAGAAGKAESERYSAQIDTGMDAADSLSTVKRGIELLDEVKTGGIDAVKLKATNLFGVTGADEAELSANLGKAVLSQLRATFGAQFTEKEGARLAEIEAGFGKSTEGNRRLLDQANKILERAARRGIRAAERLGDQDSAQEIRDAMNFTLSPGVEPQGGKPRKRYNPETGKIE